MAALEILITTCVERLVARASRWKAEVIAFQVARQALERALWVLALSDPAQIRVA